MKAYERMLRYIKIPTASHKSATTVPSSENQWKLAEMLVDELKELGLADAAVDESGIVYAHLEATVGYEDSVKLGFIAHMDTVEEATGNEINPVFHENYDGTDIPLTYGNTCITVKDFPHLREMKGRTLITSDGSTLLGVDDKAGIAEIMTMLEIIQKDQIPHGTLCIAFTPDEEIGTGIFRFDMQRFGAQYAYSLDGGAEGEIEYENFNGSKAIFDIHGVSVHPGAGKQKLHNANLIAMEINAALPSEDIPFATEDYEGFYHLVHMSGSVEHATLEYTIRDHNQEYFEFRQELLRHIAKRMNEKWGDNTVELKITKQYPNVAGIVENEKHLIEIASQACKKVGVESRIVPIRGGTDACYLCLNHVPCPNLGTGGFAYHGPLEHTSVEGMDNVTEIIVEIVKTYATMQ